MSNNYLFEPQPHNCLPILNSDKLFPINRVYCVGRNYAEHAREMGDDPDRDPPFFFCKDRTCVFPVPFSETRDLIYPSVTERLEYEVELVVALKSGGENLSREQAIESILGYSVGLDMTRRDLQTKAKKKGRPWEEGKAFDYSAPMSPICLKSDTLLKEDEKISLQVNGDIKQLSSLDHLTWSVTEVIMKLSESFLLKPGDLIMTGTPENVGAVVVGDQITASIEGLGEIVLNVV
ncbi:fumarylacetoacetate hydrolase family protein [Marinomonas mediterranea]|jgi:2-keto-4-pentenoate hydratase/2-oxohepta-3-ene-1,7-dioic acid hydratase (catechol pathway)|uniref:Fumarylacetoacetate (FAA) hydrolase n=1 Tax=Marinomonas mediterranea (strain ATCC 700492 / JCM 21426 / NBRC 103028 / MMB-1) TaxID=717774 RepID=F2K1H2_MARM1|nr:fumarylacetoacetate hydrolase family protein [Marinomonas mediterranea]ADZ92202.1 fumarylacetoacetate (FAA) hydrolase [Marinomonas mediterranea MMB-1]WCN10162.1 FAA hydrolase family protein [Marinomonas mediterranea]WCN14207.1 FAA hydrolase family protein [Marinomonas mediterranea]WCN18263.1 FAA hydrolase family protein [Marinomonas mediterranea MMB-1]